MLSPQCSEHLTRSQQEHLQGSGGSKKKTKKKKPKTGQLLSMEDPLERTLLVDK